MDICHIWCNLKPGASDLESIENMKRHFERLRRHACRLNRSKPGFRPQQLHELHNTLELQDLSQLKAKFDTVSTTTNPIESSRNAVSSNVKDVFFALTRDFPGPGRISVREKC